MIIKYQNYGGVKMKQKFTLSDFKDNINEYISDKSKMKPIVILQYGNKKFQIKLLPNSYKNDYKQYLSNVVSSSRGRKLKNATQANYLKLLEQFIRDELEPLGIAEKFNVYRTDSIEALEYLLDIISDNKSPLYKINKNDYRKIKNSKPNPYCNKNIRNYLGGDPKSSLKYYIQFLKSRLN